MSGFLLRELAKAKLRNDRLRVELNRVRKSRDRWKQEAKDWRYASNKKAT